MNRQRSYRIDDDDDEARAAFIRQQLKDKEKYILDIRDPSPEEVSQPPVKVSSRNHAVQKVDKRNEKKRYDYSNRHENIHSVKRTGVNDDHMTIMTNELNDNQYECLICCSVIERLQPIWSCTTCYKSYHICCIFRWREESLQSRRKQATGYNAQLFPIAPTQPPSRQQRYYVIQSPQLNMASSINPRLQEILNRITITNNEGEHDEGKNVNLMNTWLCPSCNTEYDTMVNELKYYCFCGKKKDPTKLPRNIFRNAHSCGEVCKRKRHDKCPHGCNQLCHPGGCPPCGGMITKKCRCEKTSKPFRCVGSLNAAEQKMWIDEEYNCGKQCDLPLPICGHPCEELCHKRNGSDCEPCEMKMRIGLPCFSHRTLSTKQIICSSLPDEIRKKYSQVIKKGGETLTSSKKTGWWACSEICGKELPCTNHVCERPCHYGDCGTCPLSMENVKTCLCGKVKEDELETKRMSCTDPIGRCENKCMKLLECGQKNQKAMNRHKYVDNEIIKMLHHCQKICHASGECEPFCEVRNPKTNILLSNIHVRCNCGKKWMEVECSQIGKMENLNCRKKCNVLLTCQKHRCGNICCSDIYHVCHKFCRKTLNCGKHECNEPCHKDKCKKCPEFEYVERRCFCQETIMPPPIPCGAPDIECKFPCSLPKDCPHETKHSCHNPEKDCPKCTEKVIPLFCVGGHVNYQELAYHQMAQNFYFSNTGEIDLHSPEVLQLARELAKKDHRLVNYITCHKWRTNGVSCAELCQKKLACEMHFCLKKCHKGPCEDANHICKQLCLTKRKLCGHICGKRCHLFRTMESYECELYEKENRCRFLIECHCRCRRRKKEIECNIVLEYKMNKILECDESCQQAEKEQIISNLLLQTNQENNHLSKITSIVKYSDFLKEFFEKDEKYYEFVEENLFRIAKFNERDCYQEFTFSNVVEPQQRRCIYELSDLCKLKAMNPYTDVRDNKCQWNKSTSVQRSLVNQKWNRISIVVRSTANSIVPSNQLKEIIPSTRSRLIPNFSKDNKRKVTNNEKKTESVKHHNRYELLFNDDEKEENQENKNVEEEDEETRTEN
ncbi:hypothetical protein SNEBB_009036 [Seison nebaliae]|nr:hypothetical protein SNEBB_009036 [Seison nebaliae]